MNYEKGFGLMGTTLIITLVVALGVGVLVWSVNRMGDGPQPLPTPTPDANAPQRTTDNPSAMISMTAQNDSGLNARYQLIALGSPSGISSETKVVISVTNAPNGVSMPAHVHSGTCANIGPVKYPLTSVVNGASVTTIDASILQFKLGLPLAINLHKSAAESGVYVACADLNADGAIDALYDSPAR